MTIVRVDARGNVIADNQVDNQIEIFIPKLPDIELPTLLNGLLYYWNFDDNVGQNTSAFWYSPSIAGSPYLYRSPIIEGSNTILDYGISEGIIGNATFGSIITQSSGAPVRNNNTLFTCLNNSSTPVNIPALGSVFTINFWAKFDNTLTNSVVMAKHSRQLGQSSGITIYAIYNGAFLHLQSSALINANTGQSEVYAFNDYNLMNDGVWRMFSLVCDGEVASFWINADPSIGTSEVGYNTATIVDVIDAENLPININFDENSFIVGGREGKSNYVDEFAIWDRALTIEELQTLYNNGVGKAYPFSNVIVEEQYDPDAQAWFDAVEATGANFGASPDSISSNKSAFNTAFLSLKSAGIWDSIRQACFFVGPSTLAGALVNIKLTGNPVNYNFTSEYYSRLIGLQGRINSGVAANESRYLDTQISDTDIDALDFHNYVSATNPYAITQSNREYIIGSNNDESIGANIYIFENSQLGYIMYPNSWEQVVPQQASIGFSRIGQNVYYNGFLGWDNYSVDYADYFSGNNFLLYKPNGFISSTDKYYNGIIRFYSIGSSTNIQILGQIVDILQNSLID